MCLSAHNLLELQYTHLGMLGGARFGRLGAWGLSALLLKGPSGPGRFGGGGAPLGAGRWPEDILLGAVGLGGGDLEEKAYHPKECFGKRRVFNPTHFRAIIQISIYLRPPAPPTQDVSTGGGRGTVTVEVEISPMMARASFSAWWVLRTSSLLCACSWDSSIRAFWSPAEYSWANSSALMKSFTYSCTQDVQVVE